MNATANPTYHGVFPVAPTPFTASGELDLDGQRRVLDCMVDQGVDGLCILANYSEQFLLADDERSILLDLCLSHVRRTGSGHRHLQSLQHADRVRPGARRRRGRRGDGDADAALPRGDAARRRQGRRSSISSASPTPRRSRSWCRTRR